MVDTWALGAMLYEKLVGVTPFYSYEMKNLIAKMNEGCYKLKTTHIFIERVTEEVAREEEKVSHSKSEEIAPDLFIPNTKISASVANAQEFQPVK